MGAIDINETAVRIRALQSMYGAEHAALTNWGLWSMDRANIFPRVGRPSVWDQFDRSKVPAWGDESEAPERVDPGPAKAEPAERQPYDELEGTILDERIHAAGGLSLEIREAIRTAYCSREVPDDQFPRLTGCTVDAFCERLEGALLFVSRFI